MASSVQRLAALHREMVQVRISAQVTVTRDNTRQTTKKIILILKHCRSQHAQFWM